MLKYKYQRTYFIHYQMCFPKPFLKAIMILMAIASCAGGVAVMVFGGTSLNEGAFSYLNEKWVMYLFIYGFGTFLLVVGLLQFWACSGENRCAIFSYEIFTISIFLIFGGFLIGVWWFKEDILKQINKEIETGDGRLQKMFWGVQKNNETIFKTICVNKSIVPECEQDDLIKIYKTQKEIPGNFWFNVGAMMEGVMSCSGLNVSLPIYYFISTKKEPPASSCQEKFIDFINESFSSFTTITIISIIVLILLFLDVLAGFCLCCHPGRTVTKHYVSLSSSFI